jgi:hypothetical protein
MGVVGRAGFAHHDGEKVAGFCRRGTEVQRTGLAINPAHYQRLKAQHLSQKEKAAPRPPARCSSIGIRNSGQEEDTRHPDVAPVSAETHLRFHLRSRWSALLWFVGQGIVFVPRTIRKQGPTMFKISAIGPEGHMIMTRNTPSEALRKAVELAGAVFGKSENCRPNGPASYAGDGSSSKERATTTPWGIRGPHQSYSLELDVMCVLSGSEFRAWSSALQHEHYGPPSRRWAAEP